ncbi:ABC-2 type transport system permease protein [Tenacibaculum sp. MAR_2009_124]|uniref:DUF3526 domain-containing protein n=1 Tax=Tenacibaculum sp. MAR_2009_124 TaxID=1250059 RepID=UPI000898A9A6|nr:DUF3526 domain-containing protein [Tenacibaculum sp. MAR_2009_124]SEC80863.1 ABC-2 type transport system permease protein [Tenacibaculum sp. MAR_2009_124]
MFAHNFKYELKTLLRSKWLILLFITMFIVIFFAGYNGQQKVNRRTADIEKIKNTVIEKDQKILQILDSLEKGHEMNISSWKSPQRPMTIGYSNPRVAAMPPKVLSFISQGQSDLFTHYVQPRAYGDSFLFNYSELSNPVQLLFGSFDLAFVIIYIIPLIIIAFSFNIFSAEKEFGSLKLIASQPISVIQWALQKIGIRYAWLVFITLLILIVTFAINGFDFAQNFSSFISMFLLIFAYITFWFSIVFSVNIFVNNSAKNAVSLLAIWVVIILIIPATISQFGNSLYPVPSRTKLITEVREFKEEISKKQDKILDNFLRDHPEYADNGNGTNYSFWHKYLASQDIIEDELAPLVKTYEEQLKEQQNWVKKWQYFSPAIILQQAFNSIAGTSTLDYQNYRQQVSVYAKEWRNYFVPMLYKNEKFSTEKFKDLPQFTFSSPKSTSVPKALIPLFIFSLGIILISISTFKLKLKKGTIIHM